MAGACSLVSSTLNSTSGNPSRASTVAGDERVAERLLAVRAHKLGPAGEIARHACRQRTTQEILAFGEALDRKALRHARHEIEHPDALLGGDPAGREPRAGKSRHVGLDDIQCCCCCCCCIEGIAAAAQAAARPPARRADAPPRRRLWWMKWSAGARAFDALPVRCVIAACFRALPQASTVARQASPVSAACRTSHRSRR